MNRMPLLRKLIPAVFALVPVFSGLTSLRAQWIHTNGPDSVTITCFGTNGNYLYAGTDRSGLFRSSDNGDSWTRLDSGMDAVTILSFFADDSMLFAGTRSQGLFRSGDKGVSWQHVDTLQSFDVLCLGKHSSYLFAGLKGNSFGPFGIMFRSGDEGRTWMRVDSNLAGGNSNFTEIGINLYTIDGYGVWRTTNNGQMWYYVAVEDKKITAVTSIAVIGKTLIVGLYNNTGFARSTNYGVTWKWIDTAAAETSVDALVATDKQVFAGQTSFGAAGDGGVRVSNDSGVHWRALNEGLEDRNIQSLAIMGKYLFAGTVSTGVWRRSLDEIPFLSTSDHSTTGHISVLAHPNPFTNSETIEVTLPQPEFAEVSVVTILGTEVADLFSGKLESGEHTFVWNAGKMPEGVYFCLLKTGSRIEKIPMILGR